MINKMKNKFMSLLAISTILALQSCGSDDDPVLESEQELITSVSIVLTPNGGGDSPVLLFTDLDGEIGSLPPEVSGATLSKGATYTAEIVLLNTIESPVVDITAEVKNEGDEHLFCYTPTGLDLDITITDNDVNALDLGILTTWEVGAATGSGTVKVVLKHQPDVKDGTCVPGDTDIEIDFPVTIE